MIPSSYFNKYFNSTLIVTVCALAFVSFFLRIWVGEDAFIFFRYVDNFVKGNGLVFNVGERVEGFTSPFWVFVLSFFRIILGWELRQIAIVLGLIFGMSLVIIVLFADHKKGIIFIYVTWRQILLTNKMLKTKITSSFF